MKDEGRIINPSSFRSYSSKKFLIKTWASSALVESSPSNHVFNYRTIAVDRSY